MAALLRRLDGLLAGAQAPALGDELRQGGVAGGQVLGQRVVGGDGAEAGAEDRVGTGGEHLQPVVAAGQVEQHAGADRAADPALLHQAHALRPALQRGQGVEQRVGEGGGAQEPLGQLAPLDRRTGAPAAAVDDLLVGQHGVLDRIPVDPRLAPVGEAGLEQVEEHLLLVPVVVRGAGGELTVPVIGQAEQAQLVAHDADVLERPVAWVHLVGQGGILGRQAEGVPAHRVQHVEAFGAPVAGDDVADGVVAGMADMEPSRRIGEHLQDVVFRPCRVLDGAEGAALVPDALPPGFGFPEIVSRHGAGVR